MNGLEILHADDDIVVVNKPAGVIVHRAPGHETDSLADELVRRYPDMAGVGSAERPGVVHRLDRETSGVLVFARNRAAYLKLRAAFESHTSVAKTYLAVTRGAPKAKSGRLETRMGRLAWDAKRMAAEVPDGLRAVTNWQVLAKRGPVALVEFKIETGRMHQIRVHAAHLGCPIVGDALYGDAAADRRLPRPPRRMLLHAVELAFPHPKDGRRVVFVAPPPGDLVHAC